MKLIKLIYLLLVTFFIASHSFASKPNWQNEKLDINIYSKKNNENKFYIIVELILKNGWFISWDNPGDVGFPTTFSWDGNIKRVANSKPEKRIFEDIIAQYGYSDKAYYLFEGLSYKNDISVNISWEACKDECEKENAYIEFNLSQNNNAIFDNVLKEANKTFPTVLKKQSYGKTIHKNNTYFLDITVKNIKSDEKISDTYFIPYQKSTIINAQKQKFFFENNTLRIIPQLEGPIKLSQGGLLIINDDAYILNLSMIHNEISLLYTLYILFLAFLGGIVLNFMPCVFPVLSLKALTIKSNKNKKQNIKNAIYYLSGVISSFLLMAFLLYILRKGGQSVGWGFQLQSPFFVSTILMIFIISLLMILDIITIKSNILNLFTKLGSINNFTAGFFAVLIASPCTGPFLGATLGFTLLISPSIYFIVFFLMGLGYGLPFALLEVYPGKIAKILPKSGNWMKYMKYILAIPVLLTCIWLSWLLYNQTFSTKSQTEEYWKAYDEVEIRRLINQNQPVFIDFTAKWCLTCLLNEKTVLHKDEFIKFAKENNINLFKADWTEPNETVGDAIKYFGRNSVPLYIFYPARNPNYIILPQILEINYLKSALSKQKKK